MKRHVIYRNGKRVFVCHSALYLYRELRRMKFFGVPGEITVETHSTGYPFGIRVREYGFNLSTMHSSFISDSYKESGEIK